MPSYLQFENHLAEVSVDTSATLRHGISMDTQRLAIISSPSTPLDQEGAWDVKNILWIGSWGHPNGVFIWWSLLSRDWKMPNPEQMSILSSVHQIEYYMVCTLWWTAGNSSCSVCGVCSFFAIFQGSIKRVFLPVASNKTTVRNITSQHRSKPFVVTPIYSYLSFRTGTLSSFYQDLECNWRQQPNPHRPPEFSLDLLFFSLLGPTPYLGWFASSDAFRIHFHYYSQKRTTSTLSFQQHGL